MTDKTPFDQVIDFSIVQKLGSEPRYANQKNEYDVHFAPTTAGSIQSESEEILTKTIVIHFFPNSWDINKKVAKSVDGKDVHTLEGDALKEYRTTVQAVFQDPWSSLSPRMRVRDIVALEGADHVEEGVSAGERFGGRAGGRGAALEEGGKIVQRDLDGRDLLRLHESGELLEALVGDLDRADLLRASDSAAVTGGEGVEDGGLAGGAEANDGEVHIGKTTPPARFASQRGR